MDIFITVPLSPNTALVDEKEKKAREKDCQKWQKEIEPTAPRIPAWSPTAVLTRP
jgi:hypothetical protein